MSHNASPERVSKLIHADSESCADMLYCAGLIIPDPFLYYEHASKSTIVVSSLEISRATKHAADGVHVLSISEACRDWGLDATTPPEPVDLITALSEHAGITQWSVPDDFPYGLAAGLQARGLTLTATTPFVPERERKTDEEAEQIAEGVRLAEIGLERGIGLLREATVDPAGVLLWNGAVLTAERLRGEVDAEIARHGGSASHTITAPGIQGADPHQCGTGPIRAGEPIVMDIFPRVDATGYFGDLTRTVVKGKAPEIVRRAYEAVRRAQERALSMVRPGVPGTDIHAAAADALDAAGFTTDSESNPPSGFFHGLGHGLGLEVHEAPRVNSRADTILQVGHVITIEPGVYYQAWGGIRLEDVVVVTDSGCRNLTVAPKVLEVP